MSLRDRVNDVIQSGILTAEMEQMMMNQFVNSLSTQPIHEDDLDQIQYLIEALNQGLIHRDYSPAPNAYLFYSGHRIQ